MSIPCCGFGTQGQVDMNLDVKVPFPLYRKLLLENKILLFFAFLLLILGGAALWTTHWAVTRGAADTVTVGAAPAMATRVVLLVAAAMTIPAGLVLLAARLVVRKAVQPLKNLTRVADEISSGNLEPIIDFGMHVNCWEIKNCGRTDCQAYNNFSQQCWFIDGTPCGDDYEPRFPQKLEQCRTCDVYQLHRGDEIVQLADSIKHMNNTLKESRSEILKSDDYQKRLIRNSFNGIVATDEKDEVTIFNRVAQELTGYEREEIIGTTRWQEIFEVDIEKQMDKPLSWEPVIRLRGMKPRESVLVHKDGSQVAVRMSGIILFEHGRNLGKVFFFEDLREINQLREDLIRSERLAATGQAAAGISHSVRNILEGFRGGAYIFKQGQRRDDHAKMEMGWDMIERNVEIISNLVKDLLNFSKTREPVFRARDVHTLLREVIKGVGGKGTEHVAFHLNIDPSASRILLDRHSFHQCLTNLARNAVEAIPKNHTGDVTLGMKLEGDRAVFMVTDTGEGMSQETIERVMGGMYSTKGSKGTGLGLQVVQKIVKEHKGTLTIDSQEGKGTTFRIEIPASGPAAQRTA